MRMNSAAMLYREMGNHRVRQATWGGWGEGVEVRVRRELVFMRADDAMGVGPGAAV